jgi:hypothetical protein
VKISKATRDEAILICQVSADSGWEFVSAYWYTCDALGSASGDSSDLALAAWNAIKVKYPINWREVDAEAAQILREGWKPGDELD